MELKSEELQTLLEQMDYLKDQKARLSFEVKQNEKEIEKTELLLQNVLAQLGVDSMSYGIYSFGWKTKVTRRFNQKAFGEAHPDLLEEFKSDYTTKSFDFSINK